MNRPAFSVNFQKEGTPAFQNLSPPELPSHLMRGVCLTGVRMSSSLLDGAVRVRTELFAFVESN